MPPLKTNSLELPDTKMDTGNGAIVADLRALLEVDPTLFVIKRKVVEHLRTQPKTEDLKAACLKAIEELGILFAV